MKNMKKHKLLTGLVCATLLTGGILLFQSCQKDDASESNVQSAYPEPKQLITTDFAKELTGTYSASRATNAKGTNKIDANAVWYSIAELESYINYIKTEGKQKGYDVDGIRLYYGVYPNSYSDSKKAGLTTVFLSPTGKKKDSQNLKFIEESHADITALQPMNYGGMGHPPKIEYPSNN